MHHALVESSQDFAPEISFPGYISGDRSIVPEIPVQAARDSL